MALKGKHICCIMKTIMLIGIREKFKRYLSLSNNTCVRRLLYVWFFSVLGFLTILAISANFFIEKIDENGIDLKNWEGQKLIYLDKDDKWIDNVTATACTKQLAALFKEESVEMFEGTPAVVDFTTLPEAKTYYTMITKSVASGSNFAGHFTLAHWGCGTDCFSYAIIDTKTGEIIIYSGANVNYHLGDYGLNSRILILEPVYAGQEKKYYKVIENQDNNSLLELVCTEISTENMYGSLE